MLKDRKEGEVVNSNLQSVYGTCYENFVDFIDLLKDIYLAVPSRSLQGL